MPSGVRQGASAASLVLFVTALLGAGPARAETLTPAPGTTLGVPTTDTGVENGLKIGEGRMHPYLELEPRYDSNVLANPADGSPIGDVIFHIRPGFNLEVPSKSLAVSFNADADYNWYQGVNAQKVNGVIISSSRLSRLLALGDLGLTANPDGAVYTYFGGSFSRSDTTPNPLLSRSVLTDLAEGRFRLGFQPGGKALLIEPGYAFDYNFYEPADTALLRGVCQIGDATCDTSAVKLFDYLNHKAEVNARLRFLPKTAFLFNGSLSRREYISSTSTPFNSTGLHLTAGLEGLLTPRFSVTARAGYGGQLNTKQGYSSVIGQLELGFLFSQTATVHLGYSRDFEPLPVIGSHFDDDKFYADGRVLLGGRVVLHGAASVDLAGFVVDHSDVIYHAEFGPDVQVTPWFTTGVGVAYSRRDSNGTLPGVAAVLLPFTRTEGWLRVQFIY